MIITIIFNFLCFNFHFLINIIELKLQIEITLLYKVDIFDTHAHYENEKPEHEKFRPLVKRATYYN